MSPSLFQTFCRFHTTAPDVADRGIVIARTDRGQPNHRGISMFIIDMHAPGVGIRPIYQVDGGMRFNETYLTDVRVPAEDQIGELNRGWRLATAMLMFERVAIGTSQTGGVQHTRTDKLIRAATKRNNLHSPVLRQSLMKMYSAEESQSLMGMRSRAEAQASKTPGPVSGFDLVEERHAVRRLCRRCLVQQRWPP
jgi:alkylation response protein AidB-like acyl-CoA dehydrogenase